MKRTKKARKRTKRPVADQTQYICTRAPSEQGGKCWFVGNCPHRIPHFPVIREGVNLCEHGFCSLMKLSCGCVPVSKK